MSIPVSAPSGGMATENRSMKSRIGDLPEGESKAPTARG